MTEFKVMDRVVRKGTTQPVYIIRGRTLEVSGRTFDTYMSPKGNFYTCGREDNKGDREEIDGEDLELAPPPDKS